MAISVGDKLPDVEVKTLGADGMPQAVRTGELLGKGKAVLFAVPGAFTPGCSKIHLPGYVQHGDERQRRRPRNELVPERTRPRTNEARTNEAQGERSPDERSST